jgi:Trk K+ transport system NAD-binding subunit
MRTPLVGKTLSESRLRETIGINVVGLWERGQFALPTADTKIHPTTVLLLAGTNDQLESFDRQFGKYQKHEHPVLVLGGGRVGQAAAKGLEERNIDYRIIEKKQSLIRNEQYVHVSAADIHTLKRAGIMEAPSIIITTHDDPSNIYLTIYCRRLRPDIQIISRSNLERSISRLHTAGADLVMSYASMAASTLLNLLKPDELLMLAQGLDIFRIGVHPSFVGKSLAESQIRKQTGCNIIAVYDQGKMLLNPEPSFRFEKHHELILIGTGEAEGQFLQMQSRMNKED